MSVLARRALAGRALHDVMLEADFRQWLDTSATSARDEDGDVVSLTFADDEPAQVLIDEAAPHRHSVVMSTLHRGSLAAWVLGPLASEGAPVEHAGRPDTAVIAVGATMTVGDVVDELIQLARRAYGARFVLEFAGSRRAVAHLAPA